MYNNDNNNYALSVISGHNDIPACRSLDMMIYLLADMMIYLLADLWT
jgi:hypothetical protein